jgi:hypothetical protein
MAKARTLKLPNLNDFNVLSGPNTSQSVQWINGNVSQTSTYSYILQPKKEGTRSKSAKPLLMLAEQILSRTNCRLPLQARHNKKHNSDKTIVRYGFDPFRGSFWRSV